MQLGSSDNVGVELFSYCAVGNACYVNYVVFMKIAVLL
jgi:hypothetical protein